MKFPLCVNCQNLAFWDGDFCCMDKMKILEYGDKLTEESLAEFPSECDTFIENKNVHLVEFFKEIIAGIIKENLEKTVIEE